MLNEKLKSIKKGIFNIFWQKFTGLLDRSKKYLFF